MVAERGFRSLIEKQRIVTMTLSAHRISTEDRRENIDSMIYQMENLEQEKVKANSNFRRAQNNLLLLIEGYELPSRKEILDVLGSLDKWSESAIEILYTLSDLYFKGSQLDKGHMIVDEMERIEEDYSKVSEVAWGYLNLLKSSNSPGLSQRTHKIGTSLTVGKLKHCNDIQSCTQTGQCANIEQKKQQYRDVSVKSDCKSQSDTTVHISSASSLTESNLGNIEADGIPTTLTCKAVNKTTSGTEGKRKTHQGCSAYNESPTLMSPQNELRRSAKYAEAVHLAAQRDVREYSYKLCQNNWKRSKSRKRSKFKKKSRSRKRYTSRKRYKAMKRHTSTKSSKSEKRYKSRKRLKFKKKSRKRSKFRKRHASRNRSKSEKRYKSRKRPKFKNKSRKRPKSRKRYKSRNRHKFKKKSKSRKIPESMKRSKLSVSPKSKKNLRSRKRTKSRKRSEYRKMSMSWKMSRSWKRCKPRKRSKSKNLPKSRNRSKYKKWSVQQGEDEKSGLWVNCTNQSSHVPCRTSYVDEIEKLSPTLTIDRNSRLFRKNEYY